MVILTFVKKWSKCAKRDEKLSGIRDKLFGV